MFGVIVFGIESVRGLPSSSSGRYLLLIRYNFEKQIPDRAEVLCRNNTRSQQLFEIDWEPLQFILLSMQLTQSAPAAL